MTDRFLADLDQLDEVVGRLARQQAALEALAARLRGELGRLHEEWDGAAAHAHTGVQAEWDRGLAAMADALAALRSAADAARANYAGAAEANVSMWRDLG